MLRATIFSLVASALAPILAIQVPLDSVSYGRFDHRPLYIPSHEDILEWNLDKLPDPNTTDNLVFETVHSLLQLWPNLRMYNGHNIVPGSIPKGTLLYHGTDEGKLPSGPEWVATDPEHAYLYCIDRSDEFRQGCQQLILATTRSLKVVYFDGASATKLPYGSMDTQDLLVWGRTGGGESHKVEDERRIQDLCRWGKKSGVDGFVRMEFDFEVMLCDFTSGVSLVSSLNLVGHQPIPLPPPRMHPEMSLWTAAMFAAFQHNHFPGETRIQLDLTGLVSFYDTQLAPSLVAIRAGQERGEHRVQYISSEDLFAARSRLESALTRSENMSSGIDWKSLLHVMVDRYAQRLELTRYLLNSSATEPAEILSLANQTQSQLRIMLTPYLVLSATPSDPLDKTELDWTIPIYKFCATAHTYAMESELDTMTDSENLLLQAVRGTSREICRVVTKMWAAGVYAGIDPLFNTRESVNIAELADLRKTWAQDLSRLMRWLDWNAWTRCNHMCGPQERCGLDARRSPSDPDKVIQPPVLEPKCTGRYTW